MILCLKLGTAFKSIFVMSGEGVLTLIALIRSLRHDQVYRIFDAVSGGGNKQMRDWDPSIDIA